VIFFLLVSFPWSTNGNFKIVLSVFLSCFNSLFCKQCSAVLQTVQCRFANSAVPFCKQCSAVLQTVQCRFANSAVPFCKQCSVILQTVQCRFANSAVPFCKQCSAILQTVQCHFANSAVPFCKQCSAIFQTVQCHFANSAVPFCKHCSAILQRVQCHFAKSAVPMRSPFYIVSLTHNNIFLFNNLVLCKMCRRAVGPHSQRPIQFNGYRADGFSPSVKRPVLEANCSPSSNDEATNERNSKAAPRVCLNAFTVSLSISKRRTA